MFLLLALPNGTPEQLQKLQTKTVHAQILWIMKKQSGILKKHWAMT